MTIPFFSLTEQTSLLKPDLMRVLERVVDSQGFANGPAVAGFEKELATFLGVREIVCVNSGTSALHAALICAGVNAGDEVITVSHTWISTVWAVTYVNATPVFADIDGGTGGLDPKDLDRCLTKKTRAIVPVHIFGMPVDMDPILDFARRKGLAVVEDCAQSIGAKYKGKQTGSFGLVNATSFYPGKNLGALGEGGAVITNDLAIAARARRLRDHAQDGRHNHVEIGFNWRMDGFQGAALSVKLSHLDRWNARRRDIAERYFRGMADVPGLRLLEHPSYAEPIWHIFPVFHDRRDQVRAGLEAKGIQTGVHYPTPVHLQPAYSQLGLKRGACPQAERAAATEMSLPMFPELPDQSVDQVIAAVRDVCRDLA